MSKLFEKIRTKIFGPRTVESLGKMAIKNKSLDDTKKFKNLITIYGNYFLKDQNCCVTMEVYENHYEDFMIGNVKHEYKFQKFYEDFEQNDTYCKFSKMIEQLSTLKKINKYCLTEKQSLLAKELNELGKLYKENDKKHSKIFEKNEEIKTMLIDYVKPKEVKKENKEISLFN